MILSLMTVGGLVYGFISSLKEEAQKLAYSLLGAGMIFAFYAYLYLDFPRQFWISIWATVFISCLNLIIFIYKY